VSEDPRAGAISYLQAELCRVAERSPDRLPLLMRTVRACLEAVDGLPREGLLQALSQRSDVEAALFTLSAAQTNPADPAARERGRALQARRALAEAEGGLWTAAQVAAALGITRQGVDWRRSHHHLLSVHHPGRRAWMYPSWQFEAAGALPGLPQVLARLREGGQQDWSALAFFLNHDLNLGERPLDRLRRGDVESVEARARAASLSITVGPRPA
jgi:hypothetical protein